MAWTIILEDEKKEALSSLNIEFRSTTLFEDDFKDQVNLLKYLDPYGDTVFNNVQMTDLIYDLKLLQEKDDNDLIQKIISLAEKCREETHTYLVFYGD